MSDEKKTLYERLGGYDAISAMANDLLPRLQSDPLAAAPGAASVRVWHLMSR